MVIAIMEAFPARVDLGRGDLVDIRGLIVAP
jgi:hypothetical protein